MIKNYPVIPWIGGKRRLAKTILPLFPEHTCYAEPFCGAAALYFLKDQSEVEVLNDINRPMEWTPPTKRHRNVPD